MRCPLWQSPQRPEGSACGLSATIGILGILESPRLQKQAPSSAVCYCCFVLVSRKEFSPLRRKSSKTEGAAAWSWEHGAGAAPHALCSLPPGIWQSCMHELPCNGHSAVILSGPFTNRITGLILKSLFPSPPSLYFC